MDLTLRAATPAERLYAYDQSSQIAEQTGCVGRLRGDVGGNGCEFRADWQTRCGHLNTAVFQAEVYEVVAALRRDEHFNGVLKDHTAMTLYCHNHPDSLCEGAAGQKFLFRADTAQYSFLLNLYPDGIEYDYTIFCYRREWLDRHMKRAEQGIRFITPDFKGTFRIPDGDRIRIITSSGDVRDRVARYVDEYHVELFTDCNSSRIYLLHDFAAQAERTGSRVIPLRSSLPDKCFSITSAADQVVIITKGEMYQRPAGARPQGVTAREGATAANEAMGVTKAQEAAMLFGSIYGWDKPGADPSHYDEQGAPIRSKHQDRGDAR